jgi:ribosomal protein S13
MPVARLLTSIKGVGTQKAERMCVYARVSGHRRVRDLTERQRNVIARVLRERRLS